MTQQKREVAFKTVEKLAFTSGKSKKERLRLWSTLAF
jgi:hypothetical protein